MSYCQICGAENVKEWTGYYNPATGEKRYREVCSINPCEHDAHLLFIENGFWASSIEAVIGHKCVRCGKRSLFGFVVN